MTHEVATAEFNALLNEAVAFRVDNYGLPSAKKLLDAVYKLSDYLAHNPHMGRLVDSGIDDAGVLRWVRVDTYIAVYRVHEICGQAALLKLLFATSNWRRRIL